RAGSSTLLGTASNSADLAVEPGPVAAEDVCAEGGSGVTDAALFSSLVCDGSPPETAQIPTPPKSAAATRATVTFRRRPSRSNGSGLPSSTNDELTISTGGAEMGNRKPGCVWGPSRIVV